LAVLRRSLVTVSAEPSKRRVMFSKEGPEILSVELDPRVGTMVEGLDRKPDYQLCLVSLFVQQAIEHQGVGETGGSPGSESQRPKDGPAQPEGGDASRI